MKPFADRLVEIVREKASRVVVGLDPRPESIPAEFGTGPRAVLDFNAEILRLVREHAVAVKPQIAFYERLGPPGLEVYAETCRRARDAGFLVIGDVKRGDVPETAKAYAEAHLETFPADAITVNPYFGRDGIDPFLATAKKRGAGLFVLVKTSNPSSKEIQDLDVGGKPLHVKVAEMTFEWGAELVGASGYSSVGAVVGATHPAEAARIRAAMPMRIFLVPGYGAQGATAADVAVCFEPGGLGAVVNASRSVVFAWERKPWSERFGAARWREAVAESARVMKEEINAAIIPR
ncbi:MAG: orotidine-5'-phosphate decarboxylase [Planctomycetes bacterium]|nr:orotidine-5'-phosphate decarboxylase [Planctomycetota bacterium]